MSDSANPLPVLERTLRVIHAAGIHVRPATRIAAVASSWDGEVRARCGTEEADARDRLDLLMLAAGPPAPKSPSAPSAKAPTACSMRWNNSSPAALSETSALKGRRTFHP